MLKANQALSIPCEQCAKVKFILSQITYIINYHVDSFLLKFWLYLLLEVRDIVEKT